VFVLRALGLGDLLTAVPALRALRRAFPERHLVLGAPAALQPLVRLAGVADAVHDTRGLADLAWGGGVPSLTVNLHGRGPQSHRLLQTLGAQRLVAFACPEAGVEGPAWDQEEHETVRWCRLVAEELGITADPSHLTLTAPDEPPMVHEAVIIHPGAAFASRRWPAERFAAVARWAADNNLSVVLTGGPDERDLAERVRRSAGLGEDALLAGRTDLRQLAALVADARLVVCGDTGMAHLASAYRTPSVVLFGPIPPARWGPPVSGPHVTLWHGDRVGDPWGDALDPALAAVTVEEVLAHATKLLQSGATARSTSPGSA